MGASLRWGAGGGATSAAPAGRTLLQSCSNTTLRPGGSGPFSPRSPQCQWPWEGTSTGGQRTRGSPRRAGQGSGPHLRRRDPTLGRCRARSPAPFPISLTSTSPGGSPDPEARLATKAAAPRPFEPHLRPAVCASSPAPRAPSGHAPTRAALTGRRLGPRRPRRPLLLRQLPAASRGARLKPLQRAKSRARRLRSLQHQFPSVVRAAPRKCHQRPFRSAPHFRPEPQSSAWRLERPPWRREPMLAGGRPGASCAAPSGGGDARTPFAERRLRRARFPGFRARPPFDPVTSFSEGRNAGPYKPCALKARGSASRGPPSTHPLAKPFRRKLTMSESWSHSSRASAPSSRHFPAGANWNWELLGTARLQHPH